MLHFNNRYIDPKDIVKDISPEDLNGISVMFVNMPIREQATPNNAPLGISLLATRLIEYGVKVNIIDLNAYRIKDKDAYDQGLKNGRVITRSEADQIIFDYFDKYGEPDLVALSGLITTLKWQIRVSEIVRKYLPDAMIVTGGGLATEFRSVLFDWMPEINAVAHSEGDDVIIKIAYDAKLMKEGGILNINKLKPYYIGEKNNKKVFLYDGGRPSNLDDLGLPAWNLLESDVYGNNLLEDYITTPIWGIGANNSSATPFDMKRSLNTVSSRGCPFACKFCYRGAQGERNYGIRSADSIANELNTFASQYNIDFMGFVDDNFAVSRSRISDLHSSMNNVIREFDIKWGTHARLDEAADISRMNGNQVINKTPLRVDQMYKAGCVYIGFGAESASKTVLEEMGKGGFILRDGLRPVGGYDLPVSMLEGVKNTYYSGIHANCTWIMGYPSEDLESLKASIAFIKWQEDLVTSGMENGTPEYLNAINSVNKNIFIATAYPGTEMFNNNKVRNALNDRFSVSFDLNGNVVADDHLKKYVESLNDASDILYDENDNPLYYGEMTEEQFSDVVSCMDEGDIFKILDL